MYPSSIINVLECLDNPPHDQVDWDGDQHKSGGQQQVGPGQGGQGQVVELHEGARHEGGGDSRQQGEDREHPTHLLSCHRFANS